MKYASLFVVGLFSFSVAQAAQTQNGFKYLYDPSSGKCTNATGEVGYNRIDSIKFSKVIDVEVGSASSEAKQFFTTLIENVDAECVDFTGVVEFNRILPAGVLPTPFTLIKSLNLKGAKMEGFSIGNLTIDYALMEGANATDMSCVYSSIGIITDEYTVTSYRFYSRSDLEKMRGEWSDTYISSLTHFCTTNSFFK